MRWIDSLMTLVMRRTGTRPDPDKVAVAQQLEQAARRLEPVLTAIQARHAQRVVREAGQRS